MLLPSAPRTTLALSWILFATAAALTAGPDRYGHSDRVERHMLPAVTTGPMDPVWSPDGRWIDGGWVAAQVVGPSSRYVADSYAFAHTSPVHVVRGGRSHRSAEASGTPSAPASSRTDSLLLDPTHPEWSRRSPPVWRARFETTEGDFLVEVTRSHAPIGADRFYNLVRLGYYDDTRFHRVIEGYIVQFGIHGDPRVNEAWRDAYIDDDPPHGTNVRGTFAFAHAPVPRNRTTQIFVNLGDNSRNDRDGFAVFGRVVEGMEVLDRLYSGYGERSGSGVRQGRQGPLLEGGNVYMDREFPELDRLIRARIVEGSGGPP